MIRAFLRAAPFFLAFLLFAEAAEARGTTVYVHRVVMVDPGDISLGSLVQTWGDIGPKAQEALAQSVAVLADAPLIIPASLYLDRLEAAFGADAIVVGSRSLVIPRGIVPDAEAYLLDRLAEFLQAQGILGAGKTELRVAQNIVRGVPPREGNPVFTLQKSSVGGAEVSFSLSGDSGNSVTGRVVIPVMDASVGASQGLRTGTPVQVVFHKGLITIEMQGKTLGTAAVGERVSVYVPDSQRSFTGRVTDGKAVSVELP
jgi:hypothetical protein